MTPLRKLKRQITDWKKIYKIYIYIKGLVSRIYEVFSDQTLTKDLKRHFTEEDTLVANEPMKRY